MAETGAHSALSGAIAMIVYRISSFPLTVNSFIIIVASFLGHFVLDLFPHGHTKKMWKEMISSAVIVPVIIVVSTTKGGVNLLFLSGLAVFSGNLFDGLLQAAYKLEQMAGLLKRVGGKIIELNLWIHWFVRNEEILQSVRKEKSLEQYKGKPVYSLNYGWYNLIPLVISMAVFCWSLTL